jgi:type IV pilus assembly protein PilF
VFQIDERLRGLPAVKDQVVALHESLNQPHLAVPGRQAGPARAYILGLRGPQGFAVFVYLYMPESAQCAVYVSTNRAVTPDKYQSEEQDALGFVESMGFIMDNLNFRGRAAEEQNAMISTLPVFQREAPKGTPVASPNDAKAAAGSSTRPTAAALGKLFSAFCLALALLTLGGCKHVPTEKEREASGLHFEMGVELQQKDPPGAMREYDQALELDPEMPEAWHAKGVLLHVVFGRLEEARAAYQKALALNPKFSAAKTNLGNLYLDEKRYDDAVKMYEEALNDMTYSTPFIAQANLGWAKYKTGDVRGGIESLKSSVTTNPKFCFGFLKLANIYDETGNLPEACRNYGKYREGCPDQGDAHMREAVCLSKMGQVEAAKKAFDLCITKADAAKDDCQRLKDALK